METLSTWRREGSTRSTLTAGVAAASTTMALLISSPHPPPGQEHEGMSRHFPHRAQTVPGKRSLCSLRPFRFEDDNCC